MNTNTTQKQRYKFRGKIIESDEKTVKQLNYALTYNSSPDRYVKIETKDK